MHVPDKSRVACFDHDARPLVLVGVEINMIALAHQAVKQGLKIGEPFDPRDTRHFPGFFLSELVTFPRFGVQGGLAKEENLPLIFLVRARIKQKNSFLLLDAGEIEQVGILAQQHGAVGIGGQDVVGVDNGQRIGQQEFFEAFAVRDEQFGV